jgi:acetamidase/formamidase
MLPKSYRVTRDNFHYGWSKSHKPVVRINSGDKVTFEVNEVISEQITRNSVAEDILKLDASKFHKLAGPVYFEEARPGDALVIDILNVKVPDWAWSAVLPGYGLLEEFDKPYLWIWKLGRRYALFKNGIKIPLRPFCGTMGVAPPEEGTFEVMPPGRHGGNMDTKHLTAGSRLILPVWVDGGLFSVGDIHAAQGDGEVCISAMECPGEVTLKFNVEKDSKIQAPRYITVGEPQPKYGYYATTGTSPDLMDASKQAVRHMIEYLVKEYALTREESYVLCSVAADLRIHQIVDKPNWTVGLMISRDIFPRKQH